MCSREHIFNDINCDKLLEFFPELFTYKTSDGSGILIFGQIIQHETNITSSILLITYEIDTWNHWNCKTAAGVYSLEYISTSYGLPLIYEFET